MGKKMVNKRGEISLRKGLHPPTRKRMTELYNLIITWHQEKKREWTIDEIIEEYGFYEKEDEDYPTLTSDQIREIINDYKKTKHQIVHTLQAGRDIAQTLRREVKMSERDYKELLAKFKILDVTYDIEEGLWTILNTFKRIEKIKNKRLSQKTLQSHKDLKDIAYVNGEIQLTHKKARNVLPNIETFHEKQLIDGVSLKKKHKNIWERTEEEKEEKEETNA